MKYYCIHCNKNLTRSQTTVISPDKEYRKCKLCGGTAIVIGISNPKWGKKA